MRIVFFGTTSYSAIMLRSIVEAGYKISLTVTLPDRPSRRGHRPSPTPVKKFAKSEGIPVFEAADLKSPELVSAIEAADAKLGVVVAFKILPRKVFTAPELGTVNVHPSLLPKLRGPAPLRWALIRGLEETGITTFLLDDRPDTGDIIMQRRVKIGPEENYGELCRKMGPLSGELLLETLNTLATGEYELRPQDPEKATKAPKITQGICQIDWEESAEELHNLIRGLSPRPGAFCRIGDKRVKILKSRIVGDSGRPGEVLYAEPGEGLVIACGRGAVRILRIQCAGKCAMDAASFLCGFSLQKGDIVS